MNYKRYVKFVARIMEEHLCSICIECFAELGLSFLGVAILDSWVVGVIVVSIILILIVLWFEVQ